MPASARVAFGGRATSAAPGSTASCRLRASSRLLSARSTARSTPAPSPARSFAVTTAEGRAYEAGGGGAAWSEDGGETWQAADAGRDRHYTWAVAVEPDDPDAWYVSASTGPFAAHGRGNPQARIYAWRGGEWRALAGGLPDPLPAMPYALLAEGGRLFAGLADGQLWESNDRGESWHACALDDDTLVRINALACAAP